MPKYDFKCQDCNRVSEVYMNMTQFDETICECGGVMKRLFPTKVYVIGCNRYIRKRGLDPQQDQLEAMKSLERRKHMKLNKGGIL